MDSNELATQVMNAVRHGQRCGSYIDPVEEPCDGLDGCEDCLALTGNAVAVVLKRALAKAAGEERTRLKKYIRHAGGCSGNPLPDGDCSCGLSIALRR